MPCVSCKCKGPFSKLMTAIKSETVKDVVDDTIVSKARREFTAAAVAGSLCKSLNGIPREQKTTAEPFHLSPWLHIYQFRAALRSENPPPALMRSTQTARRDITVPHVSGAASRLSSAALLSGYMHRGFIRWESVH